MKKIRSLLVLVTLLSAAGCVIKPEVNSEIPATYGLVGTWEYILTTPDGNVYDDGTIEFTGTSNQGDWILLNFYDVQYVGTYTVNGDAISLAGDETWQGRFTDETHISGQWQNNEASGEWKATKK